MSARTTRALCLFILAAAIVLGVAPAALAFNDVPPASSYYTEVTDLADRNIVDGYADDSFRPLNGIARAQCAKLMCALFNLPVDESMTSPFTDLGADNPTSLYPHEYVAAAYQAGITKGKSSTRFAPYDKVARLQVTSMTMRGLSRFYPQSLESIPPEFWATDGLALKPWGDHAQWALLADQLLDPESEFSFLVAFAWVGLLPQSTVPWDPMPRYEVAVLLYNAGHQKMGW